MQGRPSHRSWLVLVICLCSWKWLNIDNSPCRVNLASFGSSNWPFGLEKFFFSFFRRSLCLLVLHWFIWIVRLCVQMFLVALRVSHELFSVRHQRQTVTQHDRQTNTNSDVSWGNSPPSSDSFMKFSEEDKHVLSMHQGINISRFCNVALVFLYSAQLRWFWFVTFSVVLTVVFFFPLHKSYFSPSYRQKANKQKTEI